MRDVVVDRDDSDIFFLFVQSSGEQGIVVVIFDKDGFVRLNQRRGKFGEFTFQRIVVYYTGFDVIIIKRNSKVMCTAEVIQFFECVEILANGNFRNFSGFCQIGYVNLILVNDYLQNSLLSGIYRCNFYNVIIFNKKILTRRVFLNRKI